jgi:YD repeat-containing protein
LGTASANYLATSYAYDARGRPELTLDPAGRVTNTDYDALGRVLSTWIGPTGGSLVKVSENHYDDDWVGDGDLTESQTYVDTSVSLATDYKYDWRDRLTDSVGPDHVGTHYVLNNLGETTFVQAFADSGDAQFQSGELRAQTETLYDELGRPYRSITYPVAQDSGEVGTATLTTNTWYDPRGLAIKTAAPGQPFTKTVYDGAGREVINYTCFDVDERPSDYAAAANLNGDTIVSLTKTDYEGTRLIAIEK